MNKHRLREFYSLDHPNPLKILVACGSFLSLDSLHVAGLAGWIALGHEWCKKKAKEELLAVHSLLRDNVIQAK